MNEEQSTGQYRYGGTPTLGMAGPPRSLNVFEVGNAYAATILDVVYSNGIVRHPETGEILPWAFEDWDLSPENVGTSDPTIVVTLRDDLTWSDQTGKVVAEDVQFTFEYAIEQGASGIISALNFAHIEELTVDSPTGRTVNFFFGQNDCGWANQTLHTPIVPKHRWKDIADCSAHEPLDEGGPIGSGPFVLEERNVGEQEEFVLERRDREAIPWNRLEYLDWLDENGPFVDGLRFVVFETNDEREAALLNGEIDQPFGPIEIDVAKESRDCNHLELKMTDDDGWGHIPFNTRRVPLDDVAFRQLLVKLMDHTSVVEDFYEDFGAVKGTYVTPVAYEEWRPPEPTEIDEYEGIPVPDLTFPGKQGEFTLEDDHVREAWAFLLDHEDAKHEYSLGPATTDLTDAPEGKELYVNGVPLPKAHTDNSGVGGQGPLRMNRNPPDDEPTPRVKAVSNWVEALNRVGIPTENDYQTWGEQSRNVYIEQDFDAYETGLDNVTPNNDHYTMLFSSSGANLSGENPDERRYMNPMGYTGADELIETQRELMDPDERKPIVKRILVQIWYDAPTLVQEYIKNLQPVTTEYTGRIETVGGVNNKQTWLNMRLVN